MIKTAIVFDHRGRVKDKNQEGPLEVRLIYNRKPYYINTGVNVKMGDWVSGKIAHKSYWPELEQRIEIVRGKIEREVNICIENDCPIIPAEIKKKVYMDAVGTDSQVLAWLENQIPQLIVSDGVRRHYWTLYNRLKQYGRIKMWKDVTVAAIYEWDMWLHQIETRTAKAAIMQGKQKEKLCDGSVYNYHKYFKRMLNHAVLLDIIPANPYDKLRRQIKRGDVENVSYLTEDELEIVYNCKPAAGTQTDVARDLFIFQAYTGLSFADMQSFDINDYSLVDGKWVANSTRIKTGVPFVSQLLKPAVEVLEKYGWRIPQVNNTKYNAVLKIMGETLGINKKLTSHVARHTFATMMLRRGAKIENVSRMLGHTNITQTQKYAKVMAKSVHDDFDMVAKKLAEVKEEKKKNTNQQ